MITAVLVGAGQRGADVYFEYVRRHSDTIRCVAVAEVDKNRRERFQKAHSLSDDVCFASYDDLFEKRQIADLCFVCTLDNDHIHPVRKALALGYDVVCEKPMSIYKDECLEMGRLAKEYDRTVTICHVLRYSPFFSTIKKMLDSGKIGEIVNIVHIENVAYWHQAHSFVRGNWRNTDVAAPMILAKSCHDMDIIYYLVNSPCKRISSFGSLKYFRKENAPEGSALRCKECKVSSTCPYNAYKIYLESDQWFTPVISEVVSKQDVRTALDDGPYGRCVFHSDNTVVDHQVVNLEFENKVTASFTMCAFTLGGGRTVNIMGTHGQIIGEMEENWIEVKEFLTGKTERIILDVPTSGHSGSDEAFMDAIVKGSKDAKSSAEDSIISHMIALAAEESRITGQTIELKEFMS